MGSNDNRRPGWQARHGGEYDSSSNAANVIAFPSQINGRSPFGRLTATMVLAQFRAGVLPEGILLALMAASGLRP